MIGIIFISREPITEWDDLKEDQLVFAYWDNQAFAEPYRENPFFRAKIILLEDNFEISNADFDNDNIYIQWKCDNANHHKGVRQECRDVKDDPGYCSTGCSFAPISNISKLKFGVGSGLKNQIKCCKCKPTECSHSVTPDDFYKLQLHQIIVGLWPFDNNYFYPGRIVKMVRVNSFPPKSKRDSLESVPLNQTIKKHSSDEKFIDFDEQTGSVYVK